MALERADLEFYSSQIYKGIEGIHERLDILNGKVNANTIAIAVLKDRAEQAQLAAKQAIITAKIKTDAAVANASSVGRNQGAGWGATAGSAVATAVILIYNYFTGK